MADKSPHPRDAVIVQAIRTPLCRARKGGLAQHPPATLLSTVLSGVLLKDPTQPASNDNFLLSPSSIQDICIGNVLSPPTSAVSFRMAALSANIPHTTSLSTTNRQCSSGLQAVANIAHAIRCGSINVGIGAGVESMSANPMHELYEKFPPEVDWDTMQNCENSQEVMDCLIPMGVTSENVAKKYQLDRVTLDTFAAKSHEKAAKARSLGKFKSEIIPVGNVTEDDGIRPSTTVDKLARLRPVFDKQNGTTTAGNSSQLTDGAAAILLMSREEANKRNIPILAVWKSFAVEGVPPKIMGVGPVYAIPSALQKACIGVDDVDVYEINEAFASQAYYSIETLKLDHAKVNPNGGGIALGHPLGCTGARMIVTLVNEMRRERKRLGVVSMCIGTGMGAAAVLEVEDVRSAL
ncbi:3-ketoacyl-CoA thiolase [Skeletonema marinoi]|uniref:acetyl-CoA C-acyltransferase n=1 Tax=Skeletonema marinoi TaxID=267567 RepID=A0AAD9D6K6_9STRA|nr:3-ketoacyl-CoA thiolase [Skeletonema marinoi]